eukprot:GILI01003328.1.p2 GENE.GILI01003328.1~~GILI01003328.1.p2  ORF type:complete len:395 (-),score=108.98 GILI01003328.1:104-1288(-)
MRRSLVLKLASTVIVLGCIYTVTRKWQNVIKSHGLTDEVQHFHHPIFQVFWLFFGMFLCLPLHWALERKHIVPATKPFPAYVMAIPSTCDVFATVLDSIGLVHTHVSVHQMLRGFIVVFAGIFSILFLKRRLKLHQWVGIFLITFGIMVVGQSNVVHANITEENAPNPLLGNLLALGGQIFLAAMFVYEEKILVQYDIPILLIVGWEGFWGMLVSAGFVFAFWRIPGSDMGSLENFIQASLQIWNSPMLLAAFVTTIVVIGPFNFYGTLVTKKLSALHRCTIDASRMFFVWSFCLLVSWERFRGMQLLGYGILLMGTCLHNEIIRLPVIFSETALPEKYAFAEGKPQSFSAPSALQKKSFGDIVRFIMNGPQSAAETASLISNSKSSVNYSTTA